MILAFCIKKKFPGQFSGNSHDTGLVGCEMVTVLYKSLALNVCLISL